MDPKPDQIGPYQIEAEIGHGEVAVVYRARDTLYDRMVALKVLQPHLAQDMAFARRFVSAGREAIRLRHPNILPVYDAGQSDGHIYVAMELAKGETLAARMARQNGPFTGAATFATVEQIAAALDYAHVRGFVHHNLKPSNIFLDATGGVKLGDFDTTAPIRDDQLPVYRLAAAAYLAPEQAGGEERIGPSADVYSLGAIAYTMLAGHPPFESTNSLGLLRRIVEKAPARADSVNPNLPAHIVEALERSLSKDPAQRPPRAAELVKWLRGELPSAPKVASVPAPASPPETPVAPPVVVASTSAEAETSSETSPEASSEAPPDVEGREDESQLPAPAPDYRMPVVRSILPPLPPSPPVNVRLPFVPPAKPSAPFPAPQTSMPSARGSRSERLRPGSAVNLPAVAAVLIGALAVLLVLLALVRSADNLITRMGTPEPDEIGRVLVVDDEADSLLPTVTPLATRRSTPTPSSTPVPVKVAQRPSRTPSRTATVAGQKATADGVTQEAADRTTLRRAVVVDTAVTPRAGATPSPVQTPRPTATPEPSATPVPSATPTATASATSTPTASPPPTETATPAPTVTQTPTPLPPPPTLSGHIAYALWNVHTDRPDVYIYDIAGRYHLTPLANRRQPDYNYWGGLAANAQGGGMDNLVQMGPVGQDPWTISAHPEDAHPHWSPDAKKLVFDSAHMGDRQHRIYLQDDLTNRDERAPMMFQAWEIFGRYPIFLADGRIAFNGCNYWDTGSICGVHVVDTAGGMPSSASGWPGDIPTDNLGSQILFMSDRSGNWEVYRMNPDGSDLAQLTNHPGRDGLASASPDGSMIAFLSDRDGIWSVYVMQTDGSDPRKLFDLPGSFGSGDNDWFQERLTWGP